MIHSKKHKLAVFKFLRQICKWTSISIIKMKKVILFFFAFLGLLLALVLVVPLLFKNQIKAKLLEEIDRRIDGEVFFSDVSVSSFRHFPHMTLQLHDFLIMGKKDFIGDTLAYAKLAAVSFEYASIVKGKEIEIKSIHLTKPLVNMRILSNGDANYAIFHSDSMARDTSRFNININRWEIEDGRFILYDRPQRSYLELEGINHSGNGDFTQDISDLKIATTVEAISYSLNGIKYLDRKKLATNLVMEMDLKERKFTFKDHVFEINHFKFGFEGYLKFPKHGYEVDLRLLVNQTDFKNFLSLMPGFYVDDFRKMTVTGDFTLDGHIKGVYDFAANRIPTFALDLKVKNGGFKYDQLPKAMENINVEFIMTNDTGVPDATTFDFRDFHFDIDKNPVGGRLKIYGTSNPFIDADIKADIDLAEVEKLYPVKGITLKGKLWTDIKVKGKYAKAAKQFPVIDARLKLESGYIKSSEYAVPMEHIHIDAEVMNKSGNLSDTRIDIHKMTYQLEGEPFKVSGSISNLVDYNYDLTIDGLLDFEKLTKLYPLEGASLSGTMDIDVKTSGKLSDLEAKRFGALKSSGSIEIKNVMLSGQDLHQSISISDAKLEFTPEKIILPFLKAKIGSSNFFIKGQLFDYLPALLGTGKGIKGDLELECDTLNLNQLTSGSSPGDTAKSNLKIIEIPAYLEFSFDARIGFATFGKMEIKNLDGEIRIKDKILTLNETGFTAAGAKFGLSGDYDTRDLKHPGFDLLIDIEKLDINKAYAMFETVKNAAPAAQNTDGLFSTSYRLKGELSPDFSPVMETLTGHGTIIIDDAQIKGMQVFNHVGKITGKDALTAPRVQNIIMQTEIKGGMVRVKPFSFQVGKYFTELEGSYSFKNTMNYVLRISVPPLNKIKIPFHISGTVEKPIVKLGTGHENFDFSTF